MTRLVSPAYVTPWLSKLFTAWYMFIFNLCGAHAHKPQMARNIFKDFLTTKKSQHTHAQTRTNQLWTPRVTSEKKMQSQYFITQKTISEEPPHLTLMLGNWRYTPSPFAWLPYLKSTLENSYNGARVSNGRHWRLHPASANENFDLDICISLSLQIPSFISRKK